MQMMVPKPCFLGINVFHIYVSENPPFTAPSPRPEYLPDRVSGLIEPRTGHEWSVIHTGYSIKRNETFPTPKVPNTVTFSVVCFFSRPAHCLGIRLNNQFIRKLQVDKQWGLCGRAKAGTGLRYSELAFPSHGTHHTTNNHHLTAINS